MIARQGVGNRFALHNDERNAIGQRPGLIRAILVKPDSLVEKGVIARDDRDVSFRTQHLDDSQKLGSVVGVRQSVPDLRQHPTCRHDFAATGLGEFLSLVPSGILLVSEREEVERVGENDPHRLEDPWR